MEIDTKPVQTLIDLFDDTIEESSSLDSDACNRICSTVTKTEDLEAGLPLLRKKAEDLKENIDNCDKNIKNWQESKKLWASRSKSFMDVLGALIVSLNIPGNSLKADGVKLATSTRSSIEVDEDWLLGQYTALAAALQSQLPPYIKVKINVDKTELAAFLKTDDSLLVNHPEKIHTKKSCSTSIR